jgi:aspartate aminotransferase
MDTVADNVSFFSHIPLAPPDAIFNLTASYKADSHPQKINIGVGAYRTDELKPWILPVVRKVGWALGD